MIFVGKSGGYRHSDNIETCNRYEESKSNVMRATVTHYRDSFGYNFTVGNGMFYANGNCRLVQESC